MEVLRGDTAVWWAVFEVLVGVVIGWGVGARVANLAGRKAERRALASTIRWAHWAHAVLVTGKWLPEAVDAYATYCLDFGLRFKGVPKEEEQAAVAQREGGNG